MEPLVGIEPTVTDYKSVGLPLTDKGLRLLMLVSNQVLFLMRETCYHHTPLAIFSGSERRNRTFLMNRLTVCWHTLRPPRNWLRSDRIERPPEAYETSVHSYTLARNRKLVRLLGFEPRLHGF